MIELSIPLLLPSMNRMKGVGEHWSAWKKEKKLWSDWIKVAKSNQLKMWDNPRWERVRVEIDRYCVQDIKDEDNLIAGIKHLMDGLVAWGFIKDDKREVVGTPAIRQLRCKRTDAPRTVVRIYPLDDEGQRRQEQAQRDQVDAGGHIERGQPEADGGRNPQ